MPIFYAYAAVALSILTPLVALSLRIGSSVVFYTFVALALAALVHEGLRHLRAARVFSGSGQVVAALLAPLVSIVVTGLYVHGLSGSEYEKGMRFALALPILWLLGQVPARWLRHVQWGLMGAAFLSSVMMIGSMTWGNGGRAAIAEFGANYNAVTVADLTLLFGLSTLLTLPWSLSAWPAVERSAKIGCCALAAAATMFSETRSSWMLLPILLFILVSGRMEMKARTRLAYVLGGLVVLVAAGFVIYAFNPRFTEIVGEVQEFLHGGPRDTSIGIRMQLWEASLHLFRQHPWVGIGFSNFHQALHNLVDQGLITDYVEAHFGEPHNDLVAAMVGYGTLGLLAMTALYWLPALWFYRRMGSLSPRVRVAARVGLLLCLGYTAFSLTEMMFRNMRSVPIYSTLLVILVSLAREPEPREESPGERPEAAKL